MSFVKLCLNAFYFSVNHFTEQAEKLVDVTARQIKIIEGTEKALDKLLETSSESIKRRQKGIDNELDRVEELVNNLKLE